MILIEKIHSVKNLSYIRKNDNNNNNNHNNNHNHNNTNVIENDLTLQSDNFIAELSRAKRAAEHHG